MNANAYAFALILKQRSDLQQQQLQQVTGQSKKNKPHEQPQPPQPKPPTTAPQPRPPSTPCGPPQFSYLHPPVLTEHRSNVGLCCKPCQKDFSTAASHEAHLQTHEECGFAGCDFSATRKVVQAHFLTSHGQYSGEGYKTVDVEGQKFSILLGSTPEEVSAWRTARRASFPTATRAASREEDANKLRSAGGVPPTSSSSSLRKRPRDERPMSLEAAEDGQVIDKDPVGGGRRICKMFRKGECRRGAKCKFSHDLAGQGPAPAKKVPLSACLERNLLRRLLQKEVEEEENTLLQCLHYICGQQYFDCSSRAATAAES